MSTNITTLQNLDEKIRENRLKNLAINIVKYQNFKTNCIISKIENAGCTKNTLLTYINCGIIYLQSNKKYNKIPKQIYEYIDEALNKHIQPLTPKESEKRQARIGCNRKPICKPSTSLSGLNAFNLPKQITETFDYGVKVGNNIRIFDSEKDAKSFCDSFKFFSNESIKLIEIKFSEVKNEIHN